MIHDFSSRKLPLRIDFKNTMLRLRFFFVVNKCFVHPSYHSRTSFGVSSSVLREFFENSRRIPEAASRILEETPKDVRSILEENPKDVRRWYGYDTKEARITLEDSLINLLLFIHIFK